MRICIVGPTRSNHVYRRALAFHRRGHEVSAVTHRPRGDAEFPEHCPELPQWDTPVIRRLRYLVYMWRYAVLLRNARADIYHVHYVTGYGPWLLAALGLGPVVASVMGGDVLIDEQQPQRTRAERWLTREFLRHADVITSKSTFLTRHVSKLGVSTENVLRVVWGIDPARFKPTDVQRIRESLELGADEQVVLSPRMLKPLYNIDLVVRAFARVLERFPRARLVLTRHNPDPSYEREVTDLVERLGIGDRIAFLERVPWHDMPSLYSLADVMVAIPSSDGMPQTLLESMACGTPAVVTRLPHYEDFLEDGETGLFVDLKPESVAGAIVRLLADRALRERMGSNAMARVRKEAHFDKEVERVDGVYRALAETHGGDPPGDRRRRPRPIALLVLAWVVLSPGLARLGRHAFAHARRRP